MSVYVFPFELLKNWPIFTELGVNDSPLELTPMTYFLIFSQSVMRFDGFVNFRDGRDNNTIKFGVLTCLLIGLLEICKWC